MLFYNRVVLFFSLNKRYCGVTLDGCQIACKTRYALLQVPSKIPDNASTAFNVISSILCI